MVVPAKENPACFRTNAVSAFAADEELRDNRFLCAVFVSDPRPDAHPNFGRIRSARDAARPALTPRCQGSLENFFRVALRNNEHPWLTRAASGLIRRRPDRDREQLLRARTKIHGADIATAGRSSAADKLSSPSISPTSERNDVIAAGM